MAINRKRTMRKVNPGRFAESGSAGERPGFRKREFVKSGESSLFLFVAAPTCINTSPRAVLNRGKMMKY